MWRVLDIRGALGFAVVVKKGSMKQGIHLSNIHIRVVSSRWELGRRGVVEQRNSYKLPCAALLSGPVREPAERSAWKGRSAGSEIYIPLNRKKK